ncbi:MAG: hypothetical protein ACRECJ_10610 [Limisphaerales bacterium]
MLPHRTGRPVLFLAFAGIFLISSLTFAQNSDSLPPIEKKRPNSLKPGAWALQFQVADIFSIRGFQGFGVSLKHHFSKSRAILFGAGSGLLTSDLDYSDKYFQADTMLQSVERGLESDRVSIDFSAQYIGYFSSESDVNFFLGSGPILRFSHQEIEEKNSSIGYNPAYQSSSNTDVDTWALGLTGILGSEWFAIKQISFIAEFITSLEYQSTKQEGTGIRQGPNGLETSKNEATSHFLRFDLASAKFGFSVYFQ